MGLKRPFDAEEMQECNAKHAKQLSFNLNEMNHLDEAIPYHHVSPNKTPGLLEDLAGLCENPTWIDDVNRADKEFDTCAPFSLIPTTGFCQEDSWSGGTTQSTLSHQSSSSEFTWRPLSPVVDVYTCLMNQPPKKQIPVGSNHQADIPEYVKEEIHDRSETCINGDLEMKLMGKCILPLDDSDLCVTGQGRTECLCPDKNSIRCVRRHIMEARESLVKTIGYEKFMELGFWEMGEGVASLWTKDEDLFHKVVYSNPASMGRDFWEQLKAMFPSRTIKEIVSYYFNVFILRRRGTQNRFKTLDVDSDDDEWQVEYDIFYRTKSLDEEDNNETPSADEDNNETPSAYEDNEEEEDEETNSDDEDEEDKEESPSNDVHSVYMDKVSRDGVGEEANVEDDSCMSFELQDSNLIFTHNADENRDCNRSGDDLYSFDDRRLRSDCWNKNNDLLPTSNIIEEIFGQDNDDDNWKGK